VSRISFELIEPGRIDSMDVRFDLHGFGGGGIQGLLSGETYGPFARTSSSLDVKVLGLSVAGEPVCAGAALVRAHHRHARDLPGPRQPRARRCRDRGARRAELSVNIVGSEALGDAAKVARLPASLR
jgi:hypothetical protein